MITVSNPPSTVSVPVATTAAEGKTKVDNNMTGDPVAITTHSIDQALGVAGLDVDGKLSDGELPDIVALTNAENIFTKFQTIDSGSGYTNVIASDSIEIDDSIYNSVILSPMATTVSSLTGIAEWGTIQSFISNPVTVQIQLSTTDTLLTGAFYTGNEGTDISNNVLLLGNDASTQVLANNGPASTIHQDNDGSIHFQVFPTGTVLDPITWTDALIVNNDGTLTLHTPLATTSLPSSVSYTDASNTFTQSQTISDGMGGEIQIDGGGSISITDITTAFAQYEIHAALLEGYDPVRIDLQGGNVAGQLVSTGNVFRVSANVSDSDMSDTYLYAANGPASSISQDVDGSIHLQTSASGMVGNPITWIDSLIVNPDGTIDLASTPTTTTAPAAGMADALPALPTGYATMDIGGTPRKVAYY